MRSLVFGFILLVILGFDVSAQRLSDADLRKMSVYEDSLIMLTNKMVNSANHETRRAFNPQVIRSLVTALKTPYSFDYPFDSLIHMSVQTAPDKSFRIFTWQLHLEDDYFRYYGAIQWNQKDLKMVPLFDNRDSLLPHYPGIGHKDRWYGAVYYNIIQKTVKGKELYMLFGYNIPDYFTKRKIIEVIHFNEYGAPMFGAPVFNLPDAMTGEYELKNRFFLDYKYDAKVSVNYLKDKEMILYDHLVQLTNAQNTQDAGFTMVPDGSYQGMQWENEQWNYIDKIFHHKFDGLDNPPVPVPILDKRDDREIKSKETD